MRFDSTRLTVDELGGEGRIPLDRFDRVEDSPFLNAAPPLVGAAVPPRPRLVAASAAAALVRRSVRLLHVVLAIPIRGGRRVSGAGWRDRLALRVEVETGPGGELAVGTRGETVASALVFLQTGASANFDARRHIKARVEGACRRRLDRVEWRLDDKWKKETPNAGFHSRGTRYRPLPTSSSSCPLW